MTEPSVQSILAAIAELKGVVKDAVSAAVSAREIAANAAQIATDTAANVEAVRNDVIEIKAQLAELKPVEVFWKRALGTKEILVGTGGVLGALAAIGAAILGGIKLVTWYFVK